jgi:hypothetical protein
VTFLPRPFRRLLPGVVAAGLFAFPASAGAGAPLSGIVSAGGVPVVGASLVVRGVTAGGAVFVRILKTDADGMFVLSDAADGLYTILSVMPGFRPALARLLHHAAPDGSLSFVRLELDPPTGVLPEPTGGPLDTWIARAVAPGDVLRDVAAVIASVEEGPAPALPVTYSARDAHTARVPLSASVASTAGFGAVGESTLSRASLDVSGLAGDHLQWGASGSYSRLAAALPGDRTGDASRVALDFASGTSQSLHFATRQQSLSDDADGARYAARSLDWNGVVSDQSQASVSARMISQTRLLSTGPVADLFATQSNAVDVAARYQTELSSSTFARVTVAYRSAMNEFSGLTSPFDRETRAGAVAGLRFLDVFVLEAGATGDTSDRSRGVTPEVTLALATKDGWKVYGFASRRFERRLDDEPVPGDAGTDEADLTRSSRSLYKGGIRWQNPTGDTVVLEGSRRELTGTYRLLFDPDFLDRLDSLYFFPNDVAIDASLAANARLGETLDGRFLLRAGRLSGERPGAITSDDASWGVAQVSVRLRETDTTLGIGYRVVMQGLNRGDIVLRNDVESVDLTLAQAIPLEALRSIGSDLRALFSLELGKRREGLDAELQNRRLAGGFAMAF